MRSWKKSELDMWLANLSRIISVLWLITTTVLTTTLASAEGGIQIKHVDLLELDNHQYQLNVDAEVTLNSTLEQALKKGVTLYFVTKFSLVDPRWYWFDQEVARSKLRMGLSYNALTRQYSLSPMYESWTKNFDTLDEAVQAMGQLRGHPVTILSELKTGVDYIANLRMWLDLTRLPKPFQVETLGAKAWHLTSNRLEWYTGLPLSTKRLYQQGDL